MRRLARFDREPAGEGDSLPSDPARKPFSARLGSLVAPLSVDSPFLLLRFPAILASAVTAFLILGITSAASPLFLSSVGNAALHNDVAAQCQWVVGLQVRTPGPFSQREFGSPSGVLEARTTALREATGDVPLLGSPIVTLVGSQLTAQGPAREVTRSIRLLARDGSLANVQVILSTGGPGVWLSDSIASALQARPGQQIFVTGSMDARVPVRVAGIYRDLAEVRELPSYWCSQYSLIVQQNPNVSLPGLALVDRTTFLDLGGKLGEIADRATWEIPVRTEDITLSEARTTGDELSRLKARLYDSEDSIGSLFGIHFFPPSVFTDLPEITERTGARVSAVKGSVDTISLAGSAVALLVIGATGLYWVDRRRTEMLLLAAKGLGPGGLAVKAMIETFLPAAIGVTVGWILGGALLKALGPTELLDAGASPSAFRRALAFSVIGLGVLGLAAAVAVRRETEPTAGPPRRSVAAIPWEVPVLVLAAASLYEILTRGTAPLEGTGEVPKVDVLLVLFPVLFLGGVAGLAARGLRSLLPRLRTAGSSAPTSLYLASRRLAGASRGAITLVTAVAISVGVLLYAGTLSATVRATAQAKAKVFVGSDVSATIAEGQPIPRSLAPAATRVSKIASGAQTAQERSLTVLGVDRGTFADGVYWDSSFSDRPLPEVLSLLGPAPGDSQVPIVVAGSQLPGTGTIFLPGDEPLPYRVVETVLAFPGMEQGRTLVVMDRNTLLARDPRVTRSDEIWVKGDPGKIEAALDEAGFPTLFRVTADEVAETSDFQPLYWMLGILQALGILAGVLSMGAVLLNLQARQRSRQVSYALARRMGLSRSTHFRSTALELAGILVAGLGIGAVAAWVGVSLVFGKLDIVPNLPPAPLFRFPVLLLLTTGAFLILLVGIGAWGVQRTAERVHVAEVMRVGP